MDTTKLQPFRQLRHNSGLSIRVVSLRTGINKGRLSIIERGVMPTPDEAARIIAALSQSEPDESSDISAVIGSDTPEPVA